MTCNRAEFDEFWNDWLDVNRRAQDSGDWGVMANGRDEIRDLALGTEMLGFQGWIYPYQTMLFDDRSGQAFGLWRQLSTFASPSGEPYEIQGLGGSWFQYSGHGAQPGHFGSWAEMSAPLWPVPTVLT